MTNPPLTPLDDNELKRRRRRNSLALGLVLGFLVVLFYVLTLTKFGPGIFTSRDL